MLENPLPDQTQQGGQLDEITGILDVSLVSAS
jgi:hypothetical protein